MGQCLGRNVIVDERFAVARSHGAFWHREDFSGGLVGPVVQDSVHVVDARSCVGMISDDSGLP